MGSSNTVWFHDNELAHVRTLGELLEAIDAKITGLETDDRTTRRAFYRIRAALATCSNLDRALIRPGTGLEEIVPSKGRRRMIGDLETTVGAKLHAFRLRAWVTWILIALLGMSLVPFFWSARTAVIGLVMFTLLSGLAHATTREFEVGTVGELAERASQRAYKLMSRNYGTVDRSEVRAKLRSLLRDELGLDDSDLRDDVLIALW